MYAAAGRIVLSPLWHSSFPLLVRGVIPVFQVSAPRPTEHAHDADSGCVTIEIQAQGVGTPRGVYCTYPTGRKERRFQLQEGSDSEADRPRGGLETKVGHDRA